MGPEGTAAEGQAPAAFLVARINSNSLVGHAELGECTRRLRWPPLCGGRRRAAAARALRPGPKELSEVLFYNKVCSVDNIHSFLYHHDLIGVPWEGWKGDSFSEESGAEGMWGLEPRACDWGEPAPQPTCLCRPGSSGSSGSSLGRGCVGC
jgi:hypothetical protein